MSEEKTIKDSQSKPDERPRSAVSKSTGPKIRFTPFRTSAGVFAPLHAIPELIRVIPREEEPQFYRGALRMDVILIFQSGRVRFDGMPLQRVSAEQLRQLKSKPIPRPRVSKKSARKVKNIAA